MGGAATITLASALPDITQPVVMAGGTQDAALDQPITISATNTGIEVAGAGGTSDGTGTQLLDLRLTGFTGAAVTVTGSYVLIQDSGVDANTASRSTGSGSTPPVSARPEMPPAACSSTRRAHRSSRTSYRGTASPA